MTTTTSSSAGGVQEPRRRSTSDAPLTGEGLKPKYAPPPIPKSPEQLAAEAGAAIRVSSAVNRGIPVIEIFGPTIQGEGDLIGDTTHFVRFGGCDFRCSWCDTMYAVDPEQVRQNSTKMTAEEIVTAVVAKPKAKWVTLSGGNPALHNLAKVVTGLRECMYAVTVETQGSIYRPWISECDHVTMSPKPPSSKMVNSMQRIREFVDKVPASRLEFKIVVFDDADFAFAKYLHREFPMHSFHLQVGNPVGDSGAYQIGGLLERLRWLADKVTRDPQMTHVGVLPQMHVLLWGAQRGV